ncbi:hypothetical protein D9613_007454 [Agrocybe pediades]|uniref:Uncharacterized protein n=1 Tax=Agrocybe pediades TaxID=84607 RepID=A0A8H4QML4_9AGAR|nr:hypothetical protein D9613_007454 [Agrocybe pediades]
MDASWENQEVSTLYRNGCEAFISVDGVKLQIPKVKRLGKMRVHGMIYTEPGKPFTITWTAPRKDVDCGGDLHMNGKVLGCEYWGRRDPESSSGIVNVQSACINKSKTFSGDDLVFPPYKERPHRPAIVLTLTSMFFQEPPQERPRRVRIATFVFKCSSRDVVEWEDVPRGAILPDRVVNGIPKRRAVEVMRENHAIAKLGQDVEAMDLNADAAGTSSQPKKKKRKRDPEESKVDEEDLAAFEEITKELKEIKDRVKNLHDRKRMMMGKARRHKPKRAKRGGGEASGSNSLWVLEDADAGIWEATESQIGLLFLAMQKFAVRWACCTNDMGPSRGDVHLNRVKLGCEYIKTPDWNLGLEERKKALAVCKSQTAGSEDLAFPDQEMVQEKEVQLRVYLLTQGVPRRIKDDKGPPNNVLRQFLPGELDTTRMMRQITFIFKYLSQEELEATGIANIESSASFDHALLRDRGTGLSVPTDRGSLSASPSRLLGVGPNDRRKREIEFAETVPHTDEELRAEMADLKQRLKELELLLSYRKRVNQGGRVRVPKNVPFERPRSDWYRYPGSSEAPMQKEDDMEPNNSKKRKIAMGEGGSSSGN